MVYIEDDYNEVKGCVYKDEHYSVRDNGAIMRQKREGKPKRKYDEVWSFGIPNPQTGYMMFCNERVHRIVATAFHGPAPTPDHVVDHIDTNRQNNRPENLRWCTRLENALNNPITRKKIEYICGSVEAFLENPQLLWGHETEDSHFTWMKTVTKQEAKNCLDNWNNWANSVRSESFYNKSEHKNDEWMFENPFMNKVPNGNGGYKEIQRSAPISVKSAPMPLDASKERQEYYEEERKPLRVQSLTPNAIQVDWKNPVLFPCCPQQYTGDALKAYMNNLEKGKVFSTNKLGDSTVLRFGMPQPDNLWVMCNIRIGWKTHAFTRITFENGTFVHYNEGVYDIGDEPEDMFESILSGEGE